MKINFIKPVLLFGTLSIIAVAFSVYTFVTRPFNVGLDFAGGIKVTATFPDSVTFSMVEDKLENYEHNVSITPLSEGGKNRYYLSLSADTAEDLDILQQEFRERLQSLFGFEEILIEETTLVGGKVSGENTRNSFVVMLVVLGLIVFYITVRFKLQYALSAIIAVIHDVAITVCALSLFNFEINILTISAILTIFGYSVNDTIVLFDRVRENGTKEKMPMSDLINLSVNQVFSRTLITSLTTLAVVTALYLNTAGAINGLAFALLVGLVVGTYSSIYVAAGSILLFNRMGWKTKF